MLKSILKATCLLASAVTLAATEPPQPCLQNGNVRLVLVGDSITGQSRNAANGFAHLMEAALKAVYPESTPEIIALGGSGQSVESWQSVESGSRTAESHLDVPGISVKATLDQPADVLVIMLGMNNVLAPYIDNASASLDRWEQNYQKLIAALRERVKPKVIALGSITPCTEDPNSPKNQLISAMNERVRILAQREGARYLPTSETVWEIFRQGRTHKPDFHVTYDFVHPNGAGHLGIAMGMFTGLGETMAAEWLKTQRLEQLWQDAPGITPGISWQLASVVPAEAPGSFRFRLVYWWPVATGAEAQVAPQVKLSVPAGWQVTPQQLTGVTGEFMVVGIPDQARNTLTLEGQLGADQRQSPVVIPTPWLVAAKLVQPYWNGAQFDPEKGRTPVDDLIEKGGDFTGALEVGKGQTLVWEPLFPSVNFTGLADPASVDFAAVTHAATFEGGYAARRIYSEKDRPVKLEIGSRMFAGDTHLTVWLNGQRLYQARVANTVVDAQLKKGWNTLALKANHRTWQWQVAVGLAGVGDDALTDLRYGLPPVQGREVNGKQ